MLIGKVLLTTNAILKPNLLRAFVVRSYNVSAKMRSPDTADSSSIDQAEMRRFRMLANNWWIENGEFEALHRMNAIRVPLIRDTMINYRQSLPVKEREKLRSYLG